MTARIRNFEQGIQLCWWILLAVVIAVVVFIRIHLLAIPLERDEGEYEPAIFFICFGAPICCFGIGIAYFCNGQKELAMRTGTVGLQIGFERWF